MTQETEQARADRAWADSGKRSRVQGIADWIRRAKQPAAARRLPLTTLQDMHRARLRRAAKAAVRYEPTSLPIPRYWPHQLDRECARRMRQTEARG